MPITFTNKASLFVDVTYFPADPHSWEIYNTAILVEIWNLDHLSYGENKSIRFTEISSVTCNTRKNNFCCHGYHRTNNSVGHHRRQPAPLPPPPPPPPPLHT